MSHEVIVLSQDAVFSEVLVRYIGLALDVEAIALSDSSALEKRLARAPSVVVAESKGSAEDYAMLLRAWRLRPEAPFIVCAPGKTLEAHLTLAPLARIPTPVDPRALVRALRRALLAQPWLEDAAHPPIGLPNVLPVHLSAVDAMHILRRDPLTFNLWRETSNPSFLPPSQLQEGAPSSSFSLSRAFLPRADLSRANLTRMGLYGACLRGSLGLFTQLSGADLRDSDLEGATLVGADLTDADLRGASLTNTEFVACDLRGAEVSPGALEDARLVDCEVDTSVRAPARSA